MISLRLNTVSRKFFTKTSKNKSISHINLMFL